MSFIDFLSTPLAWLLIAWGVAFTGGLYVLALGFAGWLCDQDK